MTFFWASSECVEEIDLGERSMYLDHVYLKSFPAFLNISVCACLYKIIKTSAFTL